MLKCGNFSDKMCPDISYRGKSISVNGEPQRNRRSKHNFAGTVEYVLTLFDDTKLTYKVMLTEEYPSIWLYTEGGKEIEASLSSSFFSDPMKGYRSFIDINSFISNYIIQELSKNIDADLFKSLFLVKRKGGKMEFYHVWDFDLAFGNCNYLNAHEAVSTGPEGWYIRNHTQEGINTGWYYHIFNDPWFTAQLKTKWTTIYPQLKSLPEEIKVSAVRFMAPQVEISADGRLLTDMSGPMWCGSAVMIKKSIISWISIVKGSRLWLQAHA